MFPNKKIDLRQGLTKWQREKISKEFNKLADLAGGKNYLQSDFAKIVRTKPARELQSALKISPYSRGVFIKGGQKIKGKITVKGGALSFEVGEHNLHQLVFPLDASTEKNLEKTIRTHKRKINNAKNVCYLGTHGGKIHYVGAEAELEGDETTDYLVGQALEIFNKYLKLFEAGALRPHNEKKGDRYAAHPDKWGMTLIIENADAYKK